MEMEEELYAELDRVLGKESAEVVKAWWKWRIHGQVPCSPASVTSIIIYYKTLKPH